MKNHPNDNIYSILGKLDALKPTPEEKRFALVKEIRESVEAKGSITAGVSSVEAKLRQQFAESQVTEKAVSTAQQKFMGMVHAAQKGKKAASPEVAKVAKSMGKKDARDFAATKHKGLPAHVENECTGCAMGECSIHEGEITHPEKGVTRHRKTDFPGYPSDDLEQDDNRDAPTSNGGKGRPRKAQTKNPRKDPNAPKKTVGRPSKEKPAVYAKHADPFGRVIGAVPTSKLPSRTHTMESVVQYVAESVNFKRMMEEQHMTLSEMLECMNADMQQFQETGVCSDRLRDMMEVYSHAKRQMEEEATKTVPPAAPARGIPGNVPVPGKMERLGGGRDYYEEDSDMLEAELSELARLAGITDEGNAFSGAVAKAKADGIQPGEKISVGGKEYPVKEADATVDDNEEELANTPHPKYGSIKAITTQGDDLNRQKRQDPHTANKAANPLTNVPTLEAKLAAEYESIKKVS